MKKFAPLASIVCNIIALLFWNEAVSLNFNDAKEKLAIIDQTHLLNEWGNQTPTQQQELLSQIENLDINNFLSQKNLINHSVQTIQEPVQPFSNIVYSVDTEHISRGKQLISEGKIGCVIVAGGQGSRLRSDQPKGMYGVTLIKQKSLFQLFAEKTIAASIQARMPLELAIMTSLGNHEATTSYFEENNYFGLNKENVSFFSQSELPFLDSGGNLFLERPNKIAQGPNGNGVVLKHFYDSGIWSNWHQKGIEYLFFMFIDNPLADPFDAELVGLQDSQKSDVAMKCIERTHPDQKLGVIVEKEGKIHVVEYSELFPELMIVNDDGKLKYPCGHIGLYSFSMDFIKRAAAFDNEVPFHKAWKAVNFLNNNSVTEMSSQPIAWKYEKFIFDVLPFAVKVNAIISPKEHCFSPLKNHKGTNDLQEVQQDLQAKDRRIFEMISGTIPPDRPFELSPQFYYPTQEMLEYWKGRSLPEDPYVEPFLPT